MLLFYYLGLLPFISIPEKFFMCFLPTIINRYLLGPVYLPNSPPGFWPQKPEINALLINSTVI